MEEVYVVHGSFYYASEYIKKIDDTPRKMAWEEELNEDKRQGELLQTNGKRCMIKGKPLIFCQIICIAKLFTFNLIIYIWSHIICLELLYTSSNVEIDAIHKFVLYNVEATQQWVALYEKKRKKWDNDRIAFKWLNGKSITYHDHLKYNIPNICPNNCVVDQIIEKYGRLRNYPPSGEVALNIGIGSIVNSIIICLSTTFNLLCIFDLKQPLCFY